MTLNPKYYTILDYFKSFSSYKIDFYLSSC